MGVTGIDHVQLAMPPGGEAAAVAFYEGLLGLVNVPKPPHLAVRGGCWFEDGSTKVHLGPEPDFRPARKAHPALLVSDLEGLARLLSAAGHAVRVEGGLPGYDQRYVDDPFGNRLELLQPDR
jgi:catechol 2,3-dioxygenase-like lactoylglutathione lyase family enzyme